MPRTPKPAAPTAAPARELRVDLSQLEILDLPLIARLETAGDLANDAANALLVEAIPMLDRLIVGGLGGLKLADFPRVIAALSGNVAEASNPGN